MRSTLGRRLFRGFAWLLGAVVALAILVPVLLYVPFVQDFVKGIAVREASRATGMDIAVERLRLRWPLRLSVEGVRIVEASGDTMLAASRLDVGVRLLPLLKGDVDVDYARLDSASYNMGGRDSLMWLRAAVDHAEITASSLKMNMERIALDRALVDGARVRLVMRPDTASVPADSSSSKPMVITARSINLKNVVYTMSMMPVIDSLGCTVPDLELADGIVDLSKRRIHARYLGADSLEAVYLTPSAAWLKANGMPVMPQDSAGALTADSLMWTITADSLRVSARRGVYAMRGARPLPGLDMNWLEVTGVGVDVDSFYNRGASITVPIRRLSATERCGLWVDASGTFAMTPGLIEARDFLISTGASRLRFDAAMGLGDIIGDPSVPLRLKADGTMGLSDLVKAVPAMARTVNALPRPQLLNVGADIDGTAGELDVAALKVVYPGTLNIAASGRVKNPMDFRRMSGKVTIRGQMTGLNNIKKIIADAGAVKSLAFPKVMTLAGTVDYSPSRVSGDVRVTADDGSLAARGAWLRRAEGYDATLHALRFPVGAFMPSLGVGELTADIAASGHGYNPMSATTSMNVDVRVGSVVYNRQTYSGILLQATLGGGHADGTLSSGNPGADLDMDFTADLTSPGVCVWDVDGDIRHLDLKALGLSAEANGGSVMLASTGSYDTGTHSLDADLDVRHLDWYLGERRLVADTALVHAAVNDSAVSARVASGDLLAVVRAHTGINGIMSGIDSTMAVAKRAVEARSLDVDSLQRALPPFDLWLTMGRRNPASEFLAGTAADGPQFGSLAVTLSTDSLINLTGAVTGFSSGTTRLDSISVSAVQHGSFLAYSAAVNNRPGTMDAFAHVMLNGFVGANRMSALLRQRNIKGEQGYSIGMGVTVEDSVATLRVMPRNPIIAYRQWTVNDDNFVSYNFAERSVNANLEVNDRGSSLKLLASPAKDGNGDDILLKLCDVHLQDWLAVSPFAPPVTGDVSADMRFNWNRQELTGNGSLQLADLYYDRQRVGTFDVDMKMANDPASGALRASLDLMVDNVRTITVDGVLNDSTAVSPFGLNFNMIHFPLTTVNPFLPKGVAKLRGTLNGRMDISGDMARPSFNGWLAFDSASVSVDMLGTTLRLSPDRIPVDSNVVMLDNYDIYACNDNPLGISGSVDLRTLSSPRFDLMLNASNMMLVNSKRARGASVYGKAYVDFDASVSGDMQFMKVDASASILEGTNVTYVMASATDNLPGAESADDIVHFVQFNDTARVEKADSLVPTLAMLLTADLTVRQGSTINVDLSTDGNNRVSLQGQGNLDFSMSPVNPGRLTGRYTIDKGFVRYTPPFMSEKLFNFEEGSYVAFNGEMMNPVLNVHAVDQVKANVTQSGQNSRLVTFDVGLSVTGTLQNMNVAFDMSTDDDITVQNELQSMSPEQRANQAMNLLLYNVYSGPGTTARSNLGGNPLYAFLEGQINSWAANNIKFVDISFGLEQYDRTYEGTTSTATSYSYRVSKTLFDDRFKIVVGGSYTADAVGIEDENIASNLLNDISFEYMLNRSGSMYVRIFRHTGYESILEGEVTQTGVGFVVKRKLNSLRDFFNFGLRRKDARLTTTKNSDR